MCTKRSKCERVTYCDRSRRRGALDLLTRGARTDGRADAVPVLAHLDGLASPDLGAEVTVGFDQLLPGSGGHRT